MARSNKDLESRTIQRARDEEKARRKRASWIAKEVAAFWDKAGRIVTHRRQAEAAARRKEMMDRQLDALLGQTQRYSNMLAARLAGEAGQAAEAAATETEAGASVQDNGEASEPDAAAAVKQRDDGLPGDGEGRLLASEQEPEAVEASAVKHEDALGSYVSDATALNDDDDGDDIDDDAASADEYMADSDEEDDEATLEQEEEVARAEGYSKATEAEELDGLEADADVPLEELLASMGVPLPASIKQEPQAEERVPAPAQAAGGRSELAQLEDDALEEDADDDDAASADEYVADSDEEDDEATLEQEEEAARAEGYSKATEAAELNGLEEDADVPLEELLASMGVPLPASLGRKALVNSNGAAPGGEPSGDADDRPVPATAPSRLAQEGGLDGEDDAEDEYAADSDDEDDEATLEEEERAAAAEGAQAAAAQADELAGLAADAELDLDDLLGQYGRARANGFRVDDDNATVVKQEAELVETQSGAMSAEPPAAADDLTPASEAEETPASMADALQAMQSAQPTGYTLATHQVTTRTPFLLKGQLREYQQIGLDWLVTLYHKRLNGILADEMGLGKTIQTISLLAYLACEQGDWGPHLVVVPTSVMLNWEMEFKKWCPAFKLLTYFGSVKDRAAKRQGWSKPNAFHVCITSYTLVLQARRGGGDCAHGFVML